MSIGKSIRIYDLAREVKQDTKRVMEDLRREGADVSVASNSVSHDIAEKVRSRYFPKTEVAPKRGIKVIKAAAKPVEPAVEEVDVPQAEEAAKPEAAVEEVPQTIEPETVADVPAGAQVKRLTKKPAETPSEHVAVSKSVTKTLKLKTVETAPTPEPTPALPEAVETAPEPEAVGVTPEKAVGPSGMRVKTLILTPDAISKGIKPGERVVSEAPTQTGSLLNERPRVGIGDDRGRRPEFRGTPSEVQLGRLGVDLLHRSGWLP